MYRKYLKRIIDIVLSLVAIIVLSPVYIAISLLILIEHGPPILFKQERPGLYGKIFTLYKFRTMTDDRDENGRLLPNHLRITKLGNILRSTSLDELPELFNVLRGDMSLIGPRPLLIEYLPLYNEHQKRRHEVRPGLSGLAQVNGRNTLSWEEKFDYDVEYVEKISFFLDLQIMIRTIFCVLKREGVNKSKYVTMDKFRGTTSN